MDGLMQVAMLRSTIAFGLVTLVAVMAWAWRSDDPVTFKLALLACAAGYACQALGTLAMMPPRDSFANALTNLAMTMWLASLVLSVLAIVRLVVWL